MMFDMDILLKTHERSNGNENFMFRFIAAELGGVPHYGVKGADICLSAGPVGVSVTFIVNGIPEFIAVDEDRDPIEGWDPACVEVPEGMELDWQTILEVAPEPVDWRSMLGADTAPPSNLKIGMAPFPSADQPIRALQRIAWIELDGHRFEDFATLRIDSASEDGVSVGPVVVANGLGALVEAYYTVTIGLLGAVSVESAGVPV